MDLGTLNLHVWQFFPTNHVRHPLSGNMKGSLGMFDPDLGPGDPVGLENTDIMTAKTQVIQYTHTHTHTHTHIHIYVTTCKHECV